MIDNHRLAPLLIAGAIVTSCALWRDAVSPSLVECSPDRQYIVKNLADILDGANVFQQLDQIKSERGVEFIVCALRGFLGRVAVSPETADQRANARAYLHHLEHVE